MIYDMVCYGTAHVVCWHGTVVWYGMVGIVRQVCCFTASSIYKIPKPAAIIIANAKKVDWILQYLGNNKQKGNESITIGQKNSGRYKRKMYSDGVRFLTNFQPCLIHFCPPHHKLPQKMLLSFFDCCGFSDLADKTSRNFNYKTLIF